ncbi:YesL family protein [Consotaella aegiceratis]|uniref:YesL family protein n=1 Tax=Consotaella aegiceratis TaxID=3097961 RepID=UPI002F40C462
MVSRVGMAGLGFWGRRFNRPGPGIPKGLPARTGLALFAEIFAREWWEVLKLNLLFVLACLPIATIPAAHAAMTRLTLTMVEDRNHYLWRDFWSAFVRHGWRASALGWPLVALLCLAAYAAYIYAQLVPLNGVFAFPCAIAGVAFCALAVIGFHLFPLLVFNEDLPVGRLLRVASIAAFANFPLGLLALLVTGVTWVVYVLFYPLSVLLPLVFNFAFSSLVATFCAVAPLKRYGLEGGIG